MKNVSVWSRSRREPPFLTGVGADPRWPESAPRPWPPGAGAAQKNGGSATLIRIQQIWIRNTSDTEKRLYAVDTK